MGETLAIEIGRVIVTELADKRDLGSDPRGRIGGVARAAARDLDRGHREGPDEVRECLTVDQLHAAFVTADTFDKFVADVGEKVDDRGADSDEINFVGHGFRWVFLERGIRHAGRALR
jgi:hypothetical protein